MEMEVAVVATLVPLMKGATALGIALVFTFLLSRLGVLDATLKGSLHLPLVSATFAGNGAAAVFLIIFLLLLLVAKWLR